MFRYQPLLLAKANSGGCRSETMAASSRAHRGRVVPVPYSPEQWSAMWPYTMPLVMCALAARTRSSLKWSSAAERVTACFHYTDGTMHISYQGSRPRCRAASLLRHDRQHKTSRRCRGREQYKTRSCFCSVHATNANDSCLTSVARIYMY